MEKMWKSGLAFLWNKKRSCARQMSCACSRNCAQSKRKMQNSRLKKQKMMLWKMRKMANPQTKTTMHRQQPRMHPKWGKHQLLRRRQAGQIKKIRQRRRTRSKTEISRAGMEAKETMEASGSSRRRIRMFSMAEIATQSLSKSCIWKKVPESAVSMDRLSH